MRASSIRRQLVIAVAITQIVLTLGGVLIAVILSHRQLRMAFDAGLHGRAMSVAALVRFTEDVPHVLYFDTGMLPPPLDEAHPDFYRILDSDRKVIAVSTNWGEDFSTVTTTGRPYWDLKIRGLSYRAVRLENVPVLDHEEGTAPAELTVFYAARTIELDEAVWRTVAVTTLTSMILLAIAATIAVSAINRGLAPLSALAASASEISPSNWELNTPAASTQIQELAPLTRAMKTMLLNLQQAFTSQRAFLANAAHELKTPVAILKSTLQSLLQRQRSADEYRTGVEAALEDTDRLERLVHSMLRLARAEQWAAGNLQQEIEEIDLTSTCEISIASLRPLAEMRGVDVCLSSDGISMVRAEGEDLELVWRNLLENAIQYSPSHGRVTMSIRRVGQLITVTVEDQGPGIPKDDIAQIFDRFYRADSSRARSSGGYGLGLAIAKAIVEAYGGTISAESAVGIGTKMMVQLPFKG